jgi:hypothetical protein
MMTSLPTSLTTAAPLSWDGEGRRVSGGPLVPDAPLPEGSDELTFSDVLSVLNPLQHIPVVSSVYRWITGDTIKPAARVVGGALFGGPIGLASAAFNAIVEQVKGADFGAQALAMLGGGEAKDDTTAAPQTAAAPSDPAPAAFATEPDEGVSTGADALARLAADLRSVRDQQPVKAEAAAASVTESAATLAQGQGRGLAYYQANAGRRLPAADLSKGRVIQAQPTLPVVQTSAPIAAQLADEARKETASGTPQEGPPAAWFNAAMMRGLDRYRAMQRSDTAPQVDLSH